MIFWLPLHVVDDRLGEYGLKGGQIMRGECYDWDFLSLTKSEKCSSNFPLLVIQEVEFLCSKILFESTLRGDSRMGWVLSKLFIGSVEFRFQGSVAAKIV
jgi:hypothetical protein